jgi:hypothetical protein
MATPTTRIQLVDGVTQAFTRLREELQRAGPEISSAICVDDWSVKDLLAVRAWWTHAVIDWIEAGKLGQPLALPAPGYRWNETPRLNEDVVAAASGDTYESTLARLEGGFERVLRCADSLSDTELLDPRVFEWAGKWPISRWISINTTRQYTTARTFIRRSVRERG